MFRFFEHLVDPYCPYEEKDTPPQTLFGFLWDYSQPFKLVFLITGLTSIFAAVGELLLIYAVGWLVDIMSGDPATVLRENVWILVGLFFFVMIARPLVHFIDVALINNTIMTNLLRSSDGGRIAMCCANRSDGSKMILQGALPTA